MFEPKTFRTSTKSIAKENIFSGPINGVKKLPSIRKHSLLDNGVLLVGYKDKKGCFSFRETNEGEVHVSLYPDVSPAELTNASIWDGVHIVLDNSPGWGFKAIHSLKTHLTPLERT